MQQDVGKKLKKGTIDLLLFASGFFSGPGSLRASPPASAEAAAGGAASGRGKKNPERRGFPKLSSYPGTGASLVRVVGIFSAPGSPAPGVFLGLREHASDPRTFPRYGW